jgi:predicted secreted Zn-dependent protease
MKTHCAVLFLLMVSITTWALDKPKGEVKVEKQVENYNIRGRNSTELRAAMNTKGPLDKKLDKRFDARTDWAIGWTYKWDQSLAEKGIYRLSQWTIQLKVKVILPRWENSSDGLPFERRRWQVYEACLQLHEAGHVKLAERTAADLDEDFSTIRFFSSRDKLEEAVRVRAQKILSKHTAYHLDYDRRTRHGKTQGARFP